MTKEFIANIRFSIWGSKPYIKYIFQYFSRLLVSYHVLLVETFRSRAWTRFSFYSNLSRMWGLIFGTLFNSCPCVHKSQAQHPKLTHFQLLSLHAIYLSPTWAYNTTVQHLSKTSLAQPFHPHKKYQKILLLRMVETESLTEKGTPNSHEDKQSSQICQGVRCWYGSRSAKSLKVKGSPQGKASVELANSLVTSRNLWAHSMSNNAHNAVKKPIVPIISAFSSVKRIYIISTISPPQHPTPW